MFTGLVQEIGTVTVADHSADGTRLAIEAELAAGLSTGDSVAVNGVCLTASATKAGSFSAEVMAETLRRSALGPLEVGSPVNLETALRAGDPLGGHIVQGHVDGVGEITAVVGEGFAQLVSIAVGPDVVRYLVEKGSVTLDGVSLTVAELRPDGFVVSLIPETLERTTLGKVVPGSRVNIEVDVLAKYVERLVPR
ncbi:MAG: riboflavin synthase [Thermoleophilaceae bacterium]|nr:riboflavin synthase [Thermoleophilaceae bacterium]